MPDPPMPTHHGVEAPVEGDYPNDTLRLLYRRGSCRRFKNEKVPRELLELVLGAAARAPSGGNLQNVTLVTVQDPERRDRLMRLCGNQRFIGEAPVNLIICLDLRRNMRWAELDAAPFTASSSLTSFLMGVQETGIVGQTICLAADSVGLGSCYVGNALGRVPEIAEMLELPRGVFPTVLLSIGYPAGRVPTMKKHRLGTLLHDEKYREIPDGELLSLFREKYTEPGAPRVELTETRLKNLYETCLKVHGREFAERSVEHARRLGYISPVQRYFGLHYRADGVLTRPNSGFMKEIEDRGFDVFRDYEPPKS